MMNIRILKTATGELVPAKITDSTGIKLPSIHDGWRFNFDKHSVKLSNAETFVIVTEESPSKVEGCLIFQMIDKKIPYMAFVEIAPHNRINPKEYDHLAGCLIAFAFKLSILKGKGDYKAQLFFDVCEEDKEDEEKLIQLYRKKYGAIHMGGTKMLIIDEAGHSLIENFLDQ